MITQPALEVHSLRSDQPRRPQEQNLPVCTAHRDLPVVAMKAGDRRGRKVEGHGLSIQRMQMRTCHSNLIRREAYLIHQQPVAFFPDHVFARPLRFGSIPHAPLEKGIFPPGHAHSSVRHEHGAVLTFGDDLVGRHELDAGDRALVAPREVRVNGCLSCRVQDQHRTVHSADRHSLTRGVKANVPDEKAVETIETTPTTQHVTQQSVHNHEIVL